MKMMSNAFFDVEKEYVYILRTIIFPFTTIHMLTSIVLYQNLKVKKTHGKNGRVFLLVFFPM
jgi:hypothetical protein